MVRAVSILLFIFVGFFEIGIITLFPYPWNLMTFAPILLIAAIAGGWPSSPWWAALILGIIFDSFSPLPAGSFIVLFLLLATLLRWLFRRWFSNRSWVSLSALTIVGILLFFLGQIIIRLLIFAVTRNELLIVSWSEVWKVLWLGTMVTALASLSVTWAITTVRRLIIQKPTYVR